MDDGSSDPALGGARDDILDTTADWFQNAAKNSGDRYVVKKFQDQFLLGNHNHGRFTVAVQHLGVSSRTLCSRPYVDLLSPCLPFLYTD